MPNLKYRVGSTTYTCINAPDGSNEALACDKVLRVCDASGVVQKAAFVRDSYTTGLQHSPPDGSRLKFNNGTRTYRCVTSLFQTIGSLYSAEQGLDYTYVTKSSLFNSFLLPGAGTDKLLDLKSFKNNRHRRFTDQDANIACVVHIRGDGLSSARLEYEWYDDDDVKNTKNIGPYTPSGDDIYIFTSLSSFGPASIARTFPRPGTSTRCNIYITSSTSVTGEHVYYYSNFNGD